MRRRPPPLPLDPPQDPISGSIKSSKESSILGVLARDRRANGNNSKGWILPLVTAAVIQSNADNTTFSKKQGLDITEIAPILLAERHTGLLGKDRIPTDVGDKKLRSWSKRQR